LVTLYLAKRIPSFALWGKNLGNSTFFTLYSLGNVAKAFKRPISYDRTKVATNVFRRAEEMGLVEFKKQDGETYITITPEGDILCGNILKDFITLARIHAQSTSDKQNASKGSSVFFFNREAMTYFDALQERINNLNSDFEEVDF
jgi:hypothetical protein